MPEIIKRKKALSVSPLKASQTMGAALAFLGFNRAIPMLHGSQGCSAFGKIFFVRHFREPIPLQTTAMDQISTVMGSEDSVIEGLQTIAEKTSPELIGIPTTGLSETQGSNVCMAIQKFRKNHPQFDHVAVVTVATPDYSGCLETGFAKALEAIFSTLLPECIEAQKKPQKSRQQVNVLVGSMLTPGDLEELRDIIESFNLKPLLIPDLSDSLDGHLDENDFSPLTIGGTQVSALNTANQSLATLVIGASLYKAADIFQQKTGVKDYRFDHLMGLSAMDEFIHCLHQISDTPVPAKLERQRAQLQDAMLDTHFMLGMANIAVAADPDLLNGFSQILTGVGAKTVVAVSPINAAVLTKVSTYQVHIGDLEDLQKLAGRQGADILITNSHGVAIAERLGIPLLRAGFPQYDQLGGYQKTWTGYRGSRQFLFELANIMLSLEKGEIHPYRSIYSQKHDTGEVSHETHASLAASG